MRWKKTLVVLALVGSTALTGCAGSNTDLKRGETNCDSDGTNSHDAKCTSNPTSTPANNT
jgi:hypothetical protein